LLPPPLIQSLQNVTGFNEAAFIAAHENAAAITSIRFNPAKKINTTIAPSIDKVLWASQGYYLQQRPSFTLDPAFHGGAYYVQEASSMFLEEVLRQTIPASTAIKILDLCAAPGGKSTLIQSVLPANSFLVSNEVIKTRVNILQENCTKWGADNVIVTNNDPEDFKRLPGYFDAIVVDAPCSGSGLFRRDADAINEWSENNVALCSQRQQRILADVLPALKKGGVLIYATCSYSQEEDEAIADWLVNDGNMKSVALQLQNDWNIVTTQSALHKAYGYRFYPYKVKGEGFFIAAFIKLNDTEGAVVAKQKSKAEKITGAEMAVIENYINTTPYTFIKQHKDVLALPLHIAKELSLLQQSLYIKKAGINLGTIIRDELVPHHELAMSTILKTEIPAIDVDEATALQYLRRQDISLHTAIKGWALIKHNNIALGWIKILYNRINNYYPAAWRIMHK
jgi:16S rRNA C967 or C1407 C5-methylase (RsmB/RsmF family)/NOL1/NOP2/fmu family ribosome biogenesis protein